MSCYEKDFMMSLSDDKQTDIIDAFNTTSKYLGDILNISNIYFDNMVTSKLQLYKANTSDTEAPFLDLKCLSLLLNNLNGINCGHVRKCVMRSIIFWTIYL